MFNTLMVDHPNAYLRLYSRCALQCAFHIFLILVSTNEKHFILQLRPMVFLTSGCTHDRPSARPPTHMSGKNSAFSYFIYCSSSWIICLFSNIWGEVTNTNADSRLCHLVCSSLSHPVCHSLSQPVCHSISLFYIGHDISPLVH